jgi:hypothetical protein
MTGVTVMPCSTMEITMVRPSVAHNRSGASKGALPRAYER